MMIEIKNLKTGQIHFDSMKNEKIDQGPHFGRYVLAAYPAGKYHVSLLDADYELRRKANENQKPL